MEMPELPTRNTHFINISSSLSQNSSSHRLKFCYMIAQGQTYTQRLRACVVSVTGDAHRYQNRGYNSRVMKEIPLPNSRNLSYDDVTVSSRLAEILSN
jgi:hypothetical protein